MKYTKTNGATEQVYHNFVMFGIAFSATTFELIKTIVGIISFIIMFTVFMFKFTFPIYNNVEGIPAMKLKLDSNGVILDTVKARQNKVIMFQIETELRHKKEDQKK